MQEKYWQHDDHDGPNRFLMFVAGENLSEWFFVPFIEMVAALASSPSSAPSAFEMLRKDANPFANWEHFFRVLDKCAFTFSFASLIPCQVPR
jgi:hypothetical protein